MGAHWSDAEAGDDKPTKEQHEIAPREDPSDQELRGTPGVTEQTSVVSKRPFAIYRAKRDLPYHECVWGLTVM